MTNDRKKVLYAASTASHLRRFHAPYIEALRKEAEVKTMATGEGVDIPVLFAKSFFSPSNLGSIFKIRKILRREKFDTVLVHTTLAAFLIRAAMIGMRKRPYVLNVVHGYLFPKEGGGLKKAILLLCEKLLRRKTDDIAVMNADDLIIAKEHRLCRGEVYFIDGMGITIDPAVPAVDTALREQYATDGGDILCTFVGELSGRKNQVFLIRAVARLRGEGFPIRLLLVGEGGEREALERQILQNHMENAVLLLGNREPILPYLSITDLYVSASTSEGLPFNVMEAMSCGLPIVASNTKGQSDLLMNTEGRLYPLDDTDAFCRAIRDEIEKGRLGVGGRSYPNLEKYRLNAVFEGNRRLFSSLIQGEGRPS